jgi:hypothetical protein
LKPPKPLNHQSWSFPQREKPQYSHVIVGAGVTILSCYLLSQSFRLFLAEITTQLLSSSGIIIQKSLTLEPPSLILKLANGLDLNLALTWQRSGLFSIIIFSLLFVFLVFPLEGPLWLKIAWLEFGNVVGLTWSFIRLSTAALIAYHFGAGAFALTEFITSPIADFLWVIPVWSLGLSWVISTKRKNGISKEGALE